MALWSFFALPPYSRHLTRTTQIFVHRHRLSPVGSRDLLLLSNRTHRTALTGIRRQRPSTAAVMYRYGLCEARAADTDWIGVWCTAAVKHGGNGIELQIVKLIKRQVSHQGFYQFNFNGYWRQQAIIKVFIKVLL